MKLTPKRQAILDYLVAKDDWVSPSSVGFDLRSYPESTEWSSWASPALLWLVRNGFAERSKRGWYRAVKP